MKIAKTLLQSLYPWFVLGAAFTLSARQGHAGTIRRLSVTPERPGIVRLALGRSTVVSFMGRPEKVVAGSPGALEVNFLGKDITLRPLSTKPGNLIVYSKTGRYVLLFQMGSEANYDDVVEVIPGSSTRPLNLWEDAFHIEQVEVARPLPKGRKDEIQVPVRVTTSGKRLESAELFDALNSLSPLRCPGCTVRQRDGTTQIQCMAVISTLKCHAPAGALQIRRATP